MKTYVLAGASSRALSMYAQPIAQQYQQTARILGVYDPNQVRARYVSQESGGFPVFRDFDKMLEQTQPNGVIVTTVDRYHHTYIIRSLEAGCDVITEKPMTIDDEKCRAILAAEKRTGKKVTVTFNYRFMPYVTRIKELIREGIIGKVLSVDFEWLLDTSHGADYFRRWHRRMENSGGLFVHKATHHFDMINWWVEDDPYKVYAQGALRFYGPTRKERGERCLGCAFRHTCEFYVDYANHPVLKALYFDAEKEDGYYRDRCVFADEIDIYDTMSANVQYRSGIQLSYSLIAHSPYEGYRASINGTNGRMEIEAIESGLRTSSPAFEIKIFNRKGDVITHQVPKAVGGHGGGDEQLLKRLFSGLDIPDPLGYMADSRAGAMSILIGVAANQSIQKGTPIFIDHLLENR